MGWESEFEHQRDKGHTWWDEEDEYDNARYEDDGYVNKERAEMISEAQLQKELEEIELVELKREEQIHRLECQGYNELEIERMMDLPF